MSFENASVSIPQKRWWRMIPLMMLVYIFANLDRMNLGFAIAGGLTKDLGITTSIAGFAAGFFFIGYVFMQVPGGHLAETASAKKFIAITIIFWGGVSFITGFVQTEWQLLTCRFLLGLAEGGLYPALLAMIAHWFPEKERARANAIFMANFAIAQIFGGPLNGWMIEMWGWRGMYFREGILSICLLFIWWPLVQDRPENAKWISKEECDYINQTIKAEQDNLKKNMGAPVDYKTLLKDINLWKLTGVIFMYDVGYYGYLMWLPPILKELTKTSMTMMGFLSIIPSIATVVGLYLFAALSDRSGDRRRYTSYPALGFSLGLIMAVVYKDAVWVSFAWMVVAGFFLQGYNATFWAMPAMLFPQEVAGLARGTINAIGNIGSFLGPWVVGWLMEVTKSTDIALWFLAGAMVLGCLICLTLPDITAGIKKADPKIAVGTGAK